MFRGEESCVCSSAGVVVSKYIINCSFGHYSGMCIDGPEKEMRVTLHKAVSLLIRLAHTSLAAQGEH